MTLDAIAVSRPYPVTSAAILVTLQPDHGAAARVSAVPAIGAATILAHDLRGPLGNLMLLLDAIAEEAGSGPNERIERLAARAGCIVERMEAMLAGLLRRTRESGDPLTVRTATADLASIIDTVITQNQGLAERQGVQLHMAVAEPTVFTADSDLIIQAVDNLVVNAIRFTRPGGRVLCEAGRAGDGGFLINVIDQGPGFTDADIARAFRPFTRLSARAHAPGASTGLGLWIVRLIAEAHGGRIDVRNNRDGHGAILSLRLPAGIAEPAKLAS